MIDGRTHSLSPDVPVLDAENPWPGLAPFDEAQAGYFYGRQREVEDLFRLVRLNLLTVLYGQSGLGKTSLVRAALFPRLRAAGLLPVPIRLDYSDGAPPARTQVWQALAGALQGAGTPVAALGEDQTLWEYFHHRSLGKTATPVLVFDQFEELFTLGPERAGGAGFVRDCVMELAALIENRPPDRVEARFNREPKLVAQFDFDRQDYRVLLSLREDYLAHLHDLTGKIPSITLNNMRLTPLDGVRALEAVEKPGRRLVAPGAAEAIVRVVAGARDERPQSAGLLDQSAEHRTAESVAPLESLVVDPSLLSLLCRELNQKRQEEHLSAITPELVEANRQNILNNFYARCLAGLDEGVQIFVEEDLLTDSGFRETLSVDNAQAKLRRRGADSGALAVLVNRRLLHYELRGASTRVELTHDVLAPVVRQSRNLRREREAVQEAEARKRRELEENQRVAQQARAEAEAKYERSKRQRRAIGLFGLAMAAVAAIAVVETIQARKASRRVREQNVALSRADTTMKNQNTRLEQTNATLEQTNAALKASNDSATRATRRADSLRGVAEAMLVDFCSYGLKVINRFGDSTTGKPDLTAAYASLVELSDQSVEQMVGRNPDAACPRQLDTRVEGVSPALLIELGRRDDARQRARRALTAARNLTRFSDSLSRRVLNQTYHSLVSDLRDLGDHSGSLEAAREGLPFAREVDPKRDSMTFNWHAWLYDYGALALIKLNRLPEARTWVDSGLAVVARGRRRPDQNQQLLLYSESYLQLRRAEIAIDSTIHDSSTVRVADSAAVAAARARFAMINTVGSVEELAKMLRFQSDHARRLGRFEVAVRAADSVAANWSAILRQGRRQSDTTMIIDGLTGMVRAADLASRARRGQGRADAGVTAARAGVDSARALVQFLPSLANQVVLSDAWHTLGHALDDADRYPAADSSFRNAVRIDSLVIERHPKNEAAISADLEDYLNDVSRVITERREAEIRADTTVQVSAYRAAEERRRGIRETGVWLRRRILQRLNNPAAKDSLSEALGNLSWTYLLIDRPERSVEASREGMALGPRWTFLLPNYLNGQVLSGQDEEAAAFFRSHATQQVETPPVLFACAIVRDIRELRGRAVATDRHVSVVERLAAPYLDRCQLPKP